jgi:hypothetical protein
MKLEAFRRSRRGLVFSLAYFCMAMMFGAVEALLEFLT